VGLRGAGLICHNSNPATVSPRRRQEQAVMAKKGENREIIRLVCTEDGKSYYTTTKNKRNTTERLELMKFNSNLRKMTLHREKK
jgi:large subunit ribosomal protein L33